MQGEKTLTRMDGRTDGRRASLETTLENRGWAPAAADDDDDEDIYPQTWKNSRLALLQRNVAEQHDVAIPVRGDKLKPQSFKKDSTLARVVLNRYESTTSGISFDSDC